MYIHMCRHMYVYIYNYTYMYPVYIWLHMYGIPTQLIKGKKTLLFRSLYAAPLRTCTQIFKAEGKCIRILWSTTESWHWYSATVEFWSGRKFWSVLHSVCVLHIPQFSKLCKTELGDPMAAPLCPDVLSRYSNHQWLKSSFGIDAMKILRFWWA